MHYRFESSAKFVLRIEGFDSDDPDDRGGATRHGISLKHLQTKRELDSDGYMAGDLDRDGDIDHADVRYVTEDTALAIYRSDFWDTVRGDLLPMGIDTAVFCAAVNHGPVTAIRLLQRSTRVKVDGVLGPQTLHAVATADPNELIPEFLSRRARFYHNIVVNDATQGKWLRGWMRRLFLLQQFILTGR